MSGPYMPLDRRQLFAASAGLLAASASADEPRKDKPKYAMKKSINQWAFPYPEKMNLEQCLRLAKAAGFDGIELNYDLDNDLSPKSGPKEYAAIRKLADQVGIQISGLCSFLFWPYPLTSNDPAKRAKGMELAGKMTQAAHDLGVENLLVVPGAVHIPWRTDHEPVPNDVCDRRAREAVGKLLPQAEKLKVSLNIENIFFNLFTTGVTGKTVGRLDRVSSRVPTVIRAFSYRRFSHTEQRKGRSIARQLELRDKYLARHPELTLDTSLRLEDKAMSAFRGKNKTIGDLSQFLTLVESRTIPAGSYLIVESLDRLSREEVNEAFTLFLRLINSGIVLVQLTPTEMEYRAERMGLAEYVIALSEFTRANSESKVKSGRANDVWTDARKQGKTGQLARYVPGWIIRPKAEKNTKGSMRLNPKVAPVIVRIFELCVAGNGVVVIAQTLNAEGVPNCGTARKWNASHIRKILRSRTTIGELQPCKRDDDGGKVPVGKPVKGFYPAVVSEELFNDAQRVLRSRIRKGGSKAGSVSNLFTGLVVDQAGSTYWIESRNRRLYLVSSRRMDAPGAVLPTIPYAPFERCVLEWLAEVQLEPAKGDPLPALRSQEAALEEQLTTFKKKMKQYPGQLADLVDMYAEAEKELAGVKEDIQSAMTPRDHVLTQAKLAVDYLAESEDVPATRRLLRQHLGMLLEKIEVRIEGKVRARNKVYYLTLHFRSGEVRRVFFETPVYCSGPWSEGDDFPASVMGIRERLIERAAAG